MRIVEVRRHAERDGNDDLTPRGLAQAARAKETLDFPYDAYATSPAKRARLTMEAFGIRGPLVETRLGPRPKESFAEFRGRHEELLREGEDAVTAWFAIPECRPLLVAHGRLAWDAVRDLAARLPEGGSALAVSHGGTIEPMCVAGTGCAYEALFGNRELGHTEGVRVYVRDRAAIRVDVIRLPP